MTLLIEHPGGNYRFLPGIAPYSCGAIASPGYEIVQVTFLQQPPFRLGFERLAQILEAESRPETALCGISLRSPRPFSFRGFADFNAEYAAILQKWNLLVEGVNPVARTNVAPIVAAPDEPVMYGFSFTRRSTDEVPATFVVAGAGELPEGILEREGIVALGDTSPPGLARKARFVMDLMENRLRALGVDWSKATTVNVYTAHPLAELLPTEILNRLGAAAARGVHWHYSRPPVAEIEYEMDVRGTRTEVYVE